MLGQKGDAADLISDEMRALEGKVLITRTSYPTSASDIRRWAIAIYHPEAPPSQYRRTGAAGGEDPLVAPEDFNPFAWGAPGVTPAPLDVSAGAFERRAGVAPPRVEFMVNGGSVVEYGVPIREGDVITSEYGLKDYTVKQGKRGPLLITQTQNRWTNQRGEVVRTTLQTSVRY